MGNLSISTDETEIYYPSDWLIEGGPPYTVVGCPINDADNSWDDDSALSLVHRMLADKPWRIVQQGYILMETNNINDATQYFNDYMLAFHQWMVNNV